MNEHLHSIVWKYAMQKAYALKFGVKTIWYNIREPEIKYIVYKWFLILCVVNFWSSEQITMMTIFFDDGKSNVKGNAMVTSTFVNLQNIDTTQIRIIFITGHSN